MQPEGPFHKGSPREENRPLGRPMRRWYNITKVNLTEMGSEGVGYFIWFTVMIIVCCCEHGVRLPVP
jgi:hypothetical protein